MKRFLIVLLSICLLFSLAACSNGQTEEPTSSVTESTESEETKGIEFPNEPSAGLAYEVNEDGISCTITGIGDCSDTVLVIGQELDGYSVTAIGAFAFYHLDELQGVQLSDSITTVGEFAFYGCSALTDVIFGQNLVSIERYAFAFCTGIESVDLPTSLQRIAGWAFYYCTGLTGVTVSDLKHWCSIAFEGIYANPLRYAANLYINEELVTEVVIPEGVTEIGDWVFENCQNLERVVIHANVTSIGDRAFRACKNLTEIQYAGTRENWQLVAKDTYWNISMGSYTIYCADGMIKA